MIEKISAAPPQRGGLGFLAILIAASGFFHSTRKFNRSRFLFLGGALLLHGLTNDNSDESAEAKRTSTAAAVLMLVFAVLTIYRIFFLK